MLRLMSDADVHGHIIRGLRERSPGVDLVRAQEVGLRIADDPVILEWAAAEQRIVITQDRSTMIGFARQRVLGNLPMPGLFVLRKGTSVREAIDGILLVEQCSEPGDWRHRIEFLPL